MPLNNFRRLWRTLSCVFLFSLVLNLAHADTSIWDSFRGGKGLFSDDSGQVCVGLDQATRGVCTSRRSCSKQGGKVVGYCGVASTCCSLTTCGYAISSKEAILKMPNVGRNFPGLECSYNIVPRNRHVTQIRIDLEILTLSQPTTDNNDWSGNGDWNNGGNNANGNNGNGGWNNNGNNGGWNNNGNSNGWNNGNNNGPNNGGNWDNNHNTPTTTTSSTTPSSTSNARFLFSSGNHQRYRREVEDGEIESDYDEETFFRNGGLEDEMLTRGHFGGEYDDGWNAEVVNSEDYNTWNSDRFGAENLNAEPRQLRSTEAPSTTTTTTAPVPTPTTTTTTTAPDPTPTTTTTTSAPTTTTTTTTLAPTPTTTTTTPAPTTTTTTTTPAPTPTTTTTTPAPTTTTTTTTPAPTTSTTTTTPAPTTASTTTTPAPTTTTTTTTTTTPAPTSPTTTTTAAPTTTITTTTPASTTSTTTTTPAPTSTTPAPSTTRGTTPRPDPDNNGNHGNNGGGWGNGNGNENDQPQEYKCRHDVFEVTNHVDSRTIIPHLCGENSGQHFYISLDSFKSSSGIRISLKIADRLHHDNLATPNWRIRIRQIEDRGQRNAKDLDDFNRQDETINTGVGGLITAVSGRRLADIDEQLLAPAGCLQYYPERTGTFESFNHNSGKGPYLPNLRYAICFKRTSYVCGVKLMARKFQLSSWRNNNHQVDSDCEAPGRDNRRGDYLLIPDGVSKLGRRGTKWCGNSAQHSVVAFSPPGPLYVFFNSDKYITRNNRDIGFKMSYAVLNNC